MRLTAQKKTTSWSCLILAAAIASACAQDQQKKTISTEEDLPRFSYPVSGDTQQLLNLPEQGFAAFALPVRSDIDGILRDYSIQDRAAHRKLLQAELDLHIITADDDTVALQMIEQIRGLEEKPAAKLVSNLEQEAYLRARLAGGRTAGGTCPAGFEEALRKKTESLPWTAVGDNLKREKGFADVVSKTFFAGIAESDLGPGLSKEHALSLASAEELIEVCARLAVNVSCKQSLLSELTAYVKEHDVAKPSIWTAREAALPPMEKLTTVNVGIWDSGFDSSLFPGRLFEDPTAQDASDRHGIAFDVYCHRTHGELIPLTAQQTKDYPSSVADMQGVGELQSGLDTPAGNAFKQKIAAMSPQQMRSFYDEMGVMDGYAHGTHVTGIAARGNPAIRLAYVRTTYDNGNPHLPPTDQMLHDEAVSYAASVQWFRDHHIRVVNMSWWDRPSNFEKDLQDNGIGKDVAERKQLARHYFEIERESLYAALQGAPEILFVTIAGNSNADNAFEEDIPSSFRLPNLIVSGAVDQAGDETNFTSYGDNVLVDADGNAVESVVPGGTVVKMSGTSMAAPQVTNLAAKLLAVDPKLSPTEVIALIRDGSDASEDQRRKLINPKRSLELLQSRK